MIYDLRIKLRIHPYVIEFKVKAVKLEGFRIISLSDALLYQQTKGPLF